jgi:putative tricarboxylic transport membrane protein
MPTMTFPQILHRLAPPVLLVLLAPFLDRHVVERWNALPPGLGPASWPRVALWLLAACAALWLVLEARELWLGRSGGAADDAPADYDRTKAFVALALTLVYGAAIPRIGFAFATLLFVAAFCAVGGIRRPRVLVPVCVLGTVVLLWVFAGVARMPLDRGQGPFDAATVALYRLLGIY